jgi:hypothetical protein
MCDYCLTMLPIDPPRLGTSWSRPGSVNPSRADLLQSPIGPWRSTGGTKIRQADTPAANIPRSG